MLMYNWISLWTANAHAQIKTIQALVNRIGSILEIIGDAQPYPEHV